MNVRDYIEEYYTQNPSAKSKNKKNENAQTITQRILDNIYNTPVTQSDIKELKREDSHLTPKLTNKSVTEEKKTDVVKTSVPLVVDGKNFGNVSQKAIDAIQGGGLDTYTPVNYLEKNTIDNYMAYINSKNKTKSEQSSANVAPTIPNNVQPISPLNAKKAEREEAAANKRTPAQPEQASGKVTAAKTDSAKPTTPVLGSNVDDISANIALNNKLKTAAQPVMQAITPELKQNIAKQEAEWKATPFFDMPTIDIALEVGRKRGKLLNQYSPEIQRKLIDIFESEKKNVETWFSQSKGGGGDVGAGISSYLDSYTLGADSLAGKTFGGDEMKYRMKQNELLQMSHPLGSFIGGIGGAMNPGSAVSMISSGVHSAASALSTTKAIKEIGTAINNINKAAKSIKPIEEATKAVGEFFNATNLGKVLKGAATEAARRGAAGYATGFITGGTEALIDGETSPETIIERAIQTGERFAIFSGIGGALKGGANAIKTLPNIEADIERAVRNSSYFTQEDVASSETLHKSYQTYMKEVHPDVSKNPFAKERAQFLNDEYSSLNKLLKELEKSPAKSLIDKALSKLQSLFTLIEELAVHRLSQEVYRRSEIRGCAT